MEQKNHDENNLILTKGIYRSSGLRRCH